MKHDLTGQAFGRLTVVGYAGTIDGNSRWHCRCECGRMTTPHASALMKGVSKSCGCLRAELSGARNTTHGATRGRNITREYQTWEHMLKRCRDPRDKRFDRYGGRGIRVCERWHDYQSFRDDMGPCPPGHTLDRINNDGHYEPSNCRWATIDEQTRNRSSNHRITYNGVTLCRTDWASKIGLHQATIKGRLKRGWSVERALTTPSRCHRSTS